MRFIEVLVELINDCYPFTNSKEMAVVKINLNCIVTATDESNTILVNVGGEFFKYTLEEESFDELWRELDE